MGLRAWDGSCFGPAGEPRVVLRSPQALRRLVWRPDELGLARAYVSGELDVEGDISEGLRHIRAVLRDHGRAPSKLGLGQRLDVLVVLAALGAIGRAPAAPAEEARLAGVLHSRRRDRAAVAHHYDLGNAFYAALLDPQMVYSCAYWSADERGTSLQDAQRDKLELVCRKLDLRPGMRLLDVGCGWGALVLHAAEHHAVHATGVTLSARQAEVVEARRAQRGLTDSVDVRLQDYREIDGGPYDAIASIEMGEHVGAGNYPHFAATLQRVLRPGGRLLVQQMARGGTAPGGGAFIESYIAPDMTMTTLGRTLDALQEAGLEIRDVEALREHYVHTLRAWSRTLERRCEELTRIAGQRQVRVWRLYLAGAALAFEENRMGVNQILVVRPTPPGSSGMAPGRVARAVA